LTETDLRKTHRCSLEKNVHARLLIRTSLIDHINDSDVHYIIVKFETAIRI